MKWDDYGLIEMERDPVGDPGRLGDSFAETFRILHLELFLKLRGSTAHQEASAHAVHAYRMCRTEKGLLRHPQVPLDWREQDFSFDQWLPGFLALHYPTDFPSYADMVLTLNFDRKLLRLYNGKIAPPTVYAAIKRLDKPSAFWDLSILFQALAMRFLPFRWSDSKQRPEWSRDASADYLNWFHLIVQAESRGHTWVSRLSKRVVPESLVRRKVSDYYEPEPNSDWVVSLYDRALAKAYWTSEG